MKYAMTKYQQKKTPTILLKVGIVLLFANLAVSHFSGKITAPSIEDKIKEAPASAYIADNIEYFPAVSQERLNSSLIVDPETIVPKSQFQGFDPGFEILIKESFIKSSKNKNTEQVTYIVNRLVEISERLFGEEYKFALLPVVAMESGFYPKIKNKKSGATGLIQFLPSTMRGFGYEPHEFDQLSLNDQLILVESYFKKTARHRTRGGTTEDLREQIYSITDIYLLVFYPKAWNKSDSSTLFKFPMKAYKNNTLYDLNDDEVVKKKEVAIYLANKFPSLGGLFYELNPRGQDK